MANVLTALMLLAGASLILIGAIGAVRMPDLLLRMHATTKAGALGAGLIAVASGIYFTAPEVSVRAVAILAFVVLTAPVAAHMIGRAGYFTGAPLWEKTLKDELQENLDHAGHYLHSGPSEKQPAEHDPPDK